MSSDSWQRCSICHNRPEEYPDGIRHLYGKLPLDEFLKLDRELKRRADIETVRLDYEVTMQDDGTLAVWVSANCEACGTRWNVKKVIDHDGRT